MDGAGARGRGPLWEGGTPEGGARWGSGGSGGAGGDAGEVGGAGGVVGGVAGGVGGGLHNPIHLVQRCRSVEHHGGALPLPGAPPHDGDAQVRGGAEYLVPGRGRWRRRRGPSWCRR